MKPVSRPCKHCLRSTTNANGFCDACQKYFVKKDYMRDQRRGSPSSRGYDNTWKKFRQSFLYQHPLCAVCEKKGLLTPATEVHHIKPLSEGGERLDPRNCMALCHVCHTEITNKTVRERKNGEELYHL